MSAQPLPAGPNLKVVNTDTGEVHERCPGCLAKEDVINGLERDIRGWASRYAELTRDREAEAEASKWWPTALACFGYWQEQCKHPRSEWSADRFWLVVPFFKRKNHGPDRVLQAIAGAAFDPYTYMLRNGRQQRSDGWEKIFESVGTFERFVNKAPKGWVAPSLDETASQPKKRERPARISP